VSAVDMVSDGGPAVTADVVARAPCAVVDGVVASTPAPGTVVVHDALAGAVVPGCGMKPPHGKHSSGELGRRKDGSVALQWVTSTKTDSLSKVHQTPDGRDICWAQWCHVPCDKSSCPDWHAETFEELQAALVVAGREWRLSGGSPGSGM
jgi:hypothetical protein